MTSSLDQLFSSTVLNLLVPDTSLPFPPDTSTDAWLTRAQTNAVERRQAFFDEQLLSLLVLRIKHPVDEDTSPGDPDDPPEMLLDLLSHVQVSLEASYIPAVPTATETPRTARLLGTPAPRTTSNLNPRPNTSTTTHTGTLGPGGRLNAHHHHPSILPPSTPNPTPSTGDQDRKYVMAEGTVLVASVWGNNTAEDSMERFLLLWSEEDRGWVAVYRMAITVSFLRLSFNNPLLCLTVSATLREKPIQTHPKHPLARFLASLGEKRLALGSPVSPSNDSSSGEGQNDSEGAKLLDGLEEVNLLEGLLAGPTFGKPSAPELNLPSIRLGTVSRQKLFSLPPVLVETPSQPSPSPMTAVRKAHPTLRKSYRKTLQTVSGFRVRMRTVFVPYVLLPETEGTIQELDEEKKEQERREAGSEEKTVVLCVEIENSGDLGMSSAVGGGAGFMVERVEVTIGGEGAKATLIGWGDHGFTPDAAKYTFPLRIGPLAQFNLLYAVTFVRSPEEIDGFSFAQRTTDGISPELQRAVTINIFGKPYFPPRQQPSSSSSSRLLIPDSSSLSYPTHTFSSRWNCVLDLAAQQQQPQTAMEMYDSNAPSVLPEPASPFPGYAMYGGGASANTPGGAGGGGGGGPGGGYPYPYPYSNGSTPQYSAYTAGSRRFTLVPGAHFAGRTLKTLTPNRSVATGAAPATEQQSPQGQGSSRLSSLMQEARYIQSPTTYSAPPPPPVMPPGHIPPPLALALGGGGGSSDDGQGTVAGQGQGQGYHGGLDTPTTPAYPAYPSKFNLPPTPMSQGPVVLPSGGGGQGGGGNVGLSVEIRRERGVPDFTSGGGNGGRGGGIPVPQTPLPVVSGAFGEQKMLAKLQGASASGENVVVSVGLMPVSASSGPSRLVGRVKGQGSRSDSGSEKENENEIEQEGKRKRKEEAVLGLGPGKIYPLDIFTLDIFVFNQSLWPRRFEVTCPDRRRRRRGGEERGVYDGGSEAARKRGIPGVLPLDSRIRIGPLRPSACQSVRMDFLAVSPGVHSIDTLTLTDVESGFSANLRSVLDVVVHEPESQPEGESESESKGESESKSESDDEDEDDN